MDLSSEKNGKAKAQFFLAFGLKVTELFEELERVALTDDLPEHGLKTGDIGMVVHIYANHKGYEVEFVTLGGDLITLASLYPTQIRALESDEIASARGVESA